MHRRVLALRSIRRLIMDDLLICPSASSSPADCGYAFHLPEKYRAHRMNDYGDFPRVSLHP